MLTEITSGTEDHLHEKRQIQDYQNKDRLWVCRIFLYYSESLNWTAQNLWLGHMRPAGRGLDIAGVATNISITIKWSLKY